MGVVLETIVHRWLRVPYPLHVRFARRVKKPAATLLFIHGLGNSGEAWDDVIARLPDNVSIITIDLLGFGDSPRPDWAQYNAKTQARSVLATLLKLGITSPVIVIGHSLGSLVAIEMTKRYSLIVKSLVLCSPPLYDTSDTKLRFAVRSDTILRQLYSTALKRPDDFVRFSALAMKYQLINKAFNVTTDNIDSYMATLKTMIINQTSLRDAYSLTVPTIILQGLLDPLVVGKHLRRLAKDKPNIRVSTVASGHEVKGLFVGATVKAITLLLPKQSKGIARSKSNA